MRARLFLVSSLALSTACLDGPPTSETEGTGSGTAGASDAGSSTDGGPTSADGAASNTQGGSGSSSGSASDETAMASSSDDGGSETAEGSSGGDSSSSGAGSSSEGGSSSESSGTAGCEPITDDPTAIGDPCTGNGDCPAGYTCQPFSGIVPQESCQILCEQSCECPQGFQCVQVTDKSGIPWMQCSQ